MTESAWKSSIRRGTPTWPIRISVWTAPGRWTTRTNRSWTAPASTIRPLVAAPTAGAPAAEQPLDDRRGRRSRARSPPTRNAARAGSTPRSYAARRRAGVELRDRLLRPAGRPAVGRAALVDRLGNTPRRRGGAGRPGLEQVVQPLVAEALDLRLGERRVEGDLGEQLERRLEAGGRDVDADARRVPAGVGVERRAEALRGLDEGDRVVAARSPRSAPARRGPSRRRGPAARRPRRCAGRATRRRAAARAGRRRRRGARSAGVNRSTAGKSYGRGVPGVGRSAIDLDVLAGHAAASSALGRLARRPRTQSAGGSSGR